jgi:hypothetical protein
VAFGHVVVAEECLEGEVERRRERRPREGVHHLLEEGIGQRLVREAAQHSRQPEQQRLPLERVVQRAAHGLERRLGDLLAQLRRKEAPHLEPLEQLGWWLARREARLGCRPVGVRRLHERVRDLQQV